MNTLSHTAPAVIVKTVIFGFDGLRLKVLLRKDEVKTPWELPSSPLLPEETAEEVAIRNVKDLSGMMPIFIDEAHTFTIPATENTPGTIEIIYYALLTMEQTLKFEEEEKMMWYNVEGLPEMTARGESSVAIAQERYKMQLYFEPVAFKMLGEKFTVSDLQRLYEVILNVEFDRRNFRKKMFFLEIITDIHQKKKGGPRRAPYLYKFNYEKYLAMKAKRPSNFEF